MATDNKDITVKDTDVAYRFRRGKCTITPKFSDREDAPSVEEMLEKILRGRME